MVTLTGTFTRLDGDPATGTVKITPSRSPIMDPDGKVVISGPQVFPLDQDGKLTTEIPASDDPDLGPAFTYSIDVNLAHASWKISKVWIPHGSATVDLSEIGDYQPVPGVATRVVTIPADGTDGQVLVWDGAGFSWDYPPEGPQGPKGDLDAEQLAGAPRLTNEVHDITWIASNATINSQTARLAKFTATAQNGNIRWVDAMAAGAVYYVSAEVKTTSDQVYFGATLAPIYHSGSGDWERLTGLVTPEINLYLQVRDTRSSGWDQVEVRDPVLIDLTAVFGAGREPTTEYMDALLAKHGNYIGGVDQFAFGDALQTLTVAGPGMTLRHDTTVGTRVLLDHPGGTTMLMGDTGWRDVQNLLEPGWTLDTSLGYFRIRLTTDAFHMAGRLRVAPDAEFIGTQRSARRRIISLPAGFRVFDTYVPLGTATAAGSPITIEGDGPANLTVIRGTGTWAAGDSLAFTMSAPRQAIWPTTLPGIPGTV